MTHDSRAQANQPAPEDPEIAKRLDEMRGAMAVHELLLITMVKRLPMMELASLLGEFDDRCVSDSRARDASHSASFKAGFKHACEDLKTAIAARNPDIVSRRAGKAGD